VVPVGGTLEIFSMMGGYMESVAAKTGKWYCIDGAALIFKPEGGGDDIFGNDPPPNKFIKYKQSMYRDNA